MARGCTLWPLSYFWRRKLEHVCVLGTQCSVSAHVTYYSCCGWLLSFGSQPIWAHYANHPTNSELSSPCEAVPCLIENLFPPNFLAKSPRATAHLQMCASINQTWSQRRGSSRGGAGRGRDPIFPPISQWSLWWWYAALFEIFPKMGRLRLPW